MSPSEETAERIIRQGLVRPLLQQAEDLASDRDDVEGTAADWLALVLAMNFRRQLPRHTDYDEVAAIILDCLDTPAFA